MPFIPYARVCRMDEAMKKIRRGNDVINAQLEIGFESDSGFQDALLNIFGEVPAGAHKQTTVLRAAWIDTILGPMIAISDENVLYLLEFVTRRGLEKEVERLRARGFAIIPGDTSPIQSIMKELANYFSGTLTQFKTPYRMFGSPFQQEVWQALCKIPYGQTKSYREQAIDLERPNAYRAVANANGTNQLAIIIPCHRIISSDGSLGGYGGGLAIKQWLIDHEKRHQ